MHDELQNQDMRTVFLLNLLVIAGSISVYAQSVYGAWKGQLHAGGKELTLVFHFSEECSSMDSPDQGAYGIEAENNLLSADSVSISIPALGASFNGRLIQGKITGVFRQMGMPFKIELMPTEIKPLVRPQTPQPPYGYATEEIVFTNPRDNALLSGTLTIPQNRLADGCLPVVVLVSGSGLQDRDETLFGHKPFLVLSDWLARNGIASLRYDDRGCGKSTGSVESATTEVFMWDAASALEYLRGRNEFSAVGVLGHSEGGTIGFMLGARQLADFVISMAGTGVCGDTILAEQNNMVLQRQGLAHHVTAQDIRESVKVKSDPWLSYFCSYNPAEAIAATHCPVFALNGELDMQVTVQTNLEAIRKHLPVNELNLVKGYARLNHLFQHAQSGGVEEYAILEETMSEDVLNDIVSWIRSLK